MARPKKGGGRGGPRQPANPAPVSTPGSGARTDGGAGSKRQPIRVPTGQTYGTRDAKEASQRAVPLPDTSGPPGAPGVGAGAAPPPGAVGGIDPLEGGVFGPTQNPNEPITGPQAGILPQTPDEIIALMYQVSGGDPAIGRLLRDGMKDRAANGVG